MRFLYYLFLATMLFSCVEESKHINHAMIQDEKEITPVELALLYEEEIYKNPVEDNMLEIAIHLNSIDQDIKDSYSLLFLNKTFYEEYEFAKKRIDEKFLTTLLEVELRNKKTEINNTNTVLDVNHDYANETSFNYNSNQDEVSSVSKPTSLKPDETFTFPGSGGSEGGSGTGDLFGTGSGSGAGNGTSDSDSRIRRVISPPCPPSAGTEEGDIYLIVWIDETGKVIKAENIPSKTTTSSASVINAAIKGVKDCMRFEKRDGASVMKKELSGPIRIRRN